MPFQPINFASIPPQGIPFLRNFAQSIAQGMQAGAMPGKMRQEQEQAQLENAFKQMQMKHIGAQTAGLEQEAKNNAWIDSLMRGGGGTGNGQPQWNQQPEASQQPQTMGMFEGPQGQQASMMGMFKDQLQTQKPAMMQPPEPQGGQQPGQPGGMPFKITPEMVQAYWRNRFHIPEQLPSETEGIYQKHYAQKTATDLEKEVRKNEHDKQVEDRKFANDVKLRGIESALKTREAASRQKTGMDLTQKSITALQAQNFAGDKLIPMLKEFREMYAPSVTSSWTKPTENAAYQDRKRALADIYLASRNLSSTEENVKGVMNDLFSRRAREDEAAFKSRLDRTIKEVEEQISYNTGLLKKSTYSNEPNEAAKDGATY